jgi:hypothetical protein
MENLKNKLTGLNTTLSMIRHNQRLHEPHTEEYRKYLDSEIAILNFKKSEIEKYL